MLHPDNRFLYHLGTLQCLLCVYIIWTLIRSDGHTNRGCASDLSSVDRQWCRDHAESCHLCSNSSRCNSIVFPSDRARCHMCAGDGNGTACAAAQQESDIPPPVCLRYAPNDRCFVLRSENNTIKRGCLSSQVNASPHSQYSTCSGPGCNGRDVTKLEFERESRGSKYSFSVICVYSLIEIVVTTVCLQQA